MEYYYYDGKHTLGPYSLNDLPLSNISRNTLVWKTGMSEWQAAEMFPELSMLPPPINVVSKNISTVGNNSNNVGYNKSNTCWFCGAESAKPYGIELMKYTRELGQIGSTKYSRIVKVNMCVRCRKGFDNRQNVKRKIYLAVLITSIVASAIYCFVEPAFAELSLVERIAMGPIIGLCVGSIIAWGITTIITNNPMRNTKFRNSLDSHPDIVAAYKDGYTID